MLMFFVELIVYLGYVHGMDEPRYWRCCGLRRQHSYLESKQHAVPEDLLKQPRPVMSRTLIKDTAFDSSRSLTSYNSPLQDTTQVQCTLPYMHLISTPVL